MELPWLEEVQRPPTRLPADAPKLSPLLFDDRHQPIGSVEAWRRRRARLRQQWLDFLGRMPDQRPAIPFEVISEDGPAGCMRQLVRYAWLEHYLAEPGSGAAAPRPASR